jgi:hypothetical protein
MGNSFSAYSHVKVENHTARPGCEVTGVVNIQANSSINAMGLYLHLIGKEYTEWEETHTKEVTGSDGSSKSESHTEVYKAKRTVLTHSLLLHHFDGNLEKGQYSIPFALRIPDEILPSFEYNKGVNAKRYYTIKAKLEENKNLKAQKSYLVVLSLPKYLENAEPAISKSLIHVRNCLCFGSDTSRVSLNLSKNAYHLADRLDATLIVDQTDCKKRLINIEFSLYRKLRVKNNSSRSFIDRKQVFKEERVSMSSNLKGSIYTYDFSFELSVDNDLWQTPSSESELIECIYEVDARLDYDTFCSGTVYQVTTPVSILNIGKIMRMQLVQQHPQMPEDWNPLNLATAPPEEI